LESYYSDASLMRRLNMDQLQLSASRRQLIQAGLIAHDKPLYQVLSLKPVTGTRSGAVSVAQVLRKIMGGQTTSGSVTADRRWSAAADLAVCGVPGPQGVGR
jgi:hypothetical protein